MNRCKSANLFAACAILVFATSAAAQKKAEKVEKTPEPPKPTLVKPGKMVEKCVTLSSAQKLEYQFTTSKPVDFNIHYHKGETVYYPVKRNKTTAEADVYTPGPGRSEYCLMWENKSSASDIEVNYAFRVVN